MALLIAPIAVVDRADAACAPASSVSNATVTCSGATVDQDGTVGYGTNNDRGNTYNILSGASVTGTDIGLFFNDLGAINNSGTISGAGVGNSGGIVSAGNGNVNNAVAGVISGTGANSNGIAFFSTGSVTNSGRISGTARGIFLQNGEVTNTGTGTIEGDDGVKFGNVGKVTNAGSISAVGTAGRGIRATTVTVLNSGNITGLVGIQAVSADVTNSGAISSVSGNGILAQTASVTNSGTISTGTNAVALSADNTTLVNSGTIFAGAGSKGINSDTAVVANTGTGVILGGLNGVVATVIATINNAGLISGSTSSAILTDTAVVTNTRIGIISSGLNGIEATTLATVSNAGSISGGASGNGIVSASADVMNTSTGTISSGFIGIQTTTTAKVNNAGSISGRLLGISAAAVDVTNTGVISGGQFGIAASTATVRNFGTISGTAVNSLGTVGVGISGDNVNVANSGLISGAAGGHGIDAFSSATVINSGTISGDVGIQAGGGATITTSGTITGTGGTAIAFTAGAGNTLTLASGFAINGIVTNAAAAITNTLQLGGTGNGTFDVSAIGAAAQYRNFGSFNKVDTSVFTLTGSSTFAGPVNVNGGTLAVNGNTASFGSLSVNSGGTLGGNGVVGNTAINGGTLAPGNSIGLLTVQGNLVFTTAASYLVEVSATAADRTNVTGVASPGGATVNAVFAPGSNIVKQYTILNATGGVSGIFNPVVGSNNANIQSTLSYDANDVFLNVKLAFVAPNGLNTNQQNVAKALSGFFNSTGSIPAVFATLGLSGLTQASGEAATGSQQTTFNAMNQFMGLLTDPFIAGRGDAMGSSGGAQQFAEEGDRAKAYAADGKPRSASERDAYAAIYRKAPVAEAFAQRWSVWAAGYGGSQSTDGNAALGSNTATSRVYGTAVGADYRFSPFMLAGFALAGGGTSFSVANGLGGGRSDLFQAGAFVRHSVGPTYISAALAYGWQDITTDRTVTIAGIDQLRAKFNANAWSGRVEGGYRFATQGFGLTPYVAGQSTTFELPTYAETAVIGANTFALAYAAKNVTASRSELGLRSDKSFVMQDAILTLRGRAAWAHDFNPDRTIAATFQALPGASFVVNGAAQSSDAALATASAEMKLLNGVSLVATFEGEFSSITRSYAGKGVARYAW